MAAITIDMVKELRESTGAGMMDCKKALEETGGDVAKAQEILWAKGLAKAAKRAEREASEGVLDLYSHGNGRVGVMVEVNCETDFVGRSEQFRTFAHELALQIAAANPEYIRPEDVPADVIEEERKASAHLTEGKPPVVVEKILQGRLDKFYGDKCLVRQVYIRDDSITIQDLLNRTVAAIGENVIIRRFVRWELGESTASESTAK